jgi:outer membrane murein-binding lipoprotein Lpp
VEKQLKGMDNMKKLIIGAVSVAFLALVGCAQEEVKPVAKQEETKQEKKTPKEQKIETDVKTSHLGLDIEIKGVVFTDDAVGLHMVAKNNGSKPVEGFFPNLGNVKMGDLQLNAQGDFDGALPDSGTVEPGAKFEVPIVYVMPQGKKLDPSDIKSIEVNMGEVFSEDYSKEEKIKFTVPIR